MTIDYAKFAAHPTMYRGVKFRSRLEATWAAFFDGIGWRWEYEPFDMNGWVPDFLIIGKKRNVLIEVKPITEFQDDIADKIFRSGACEGEYRTVLVGCQIFEKNDEYSRMRPFIGWVCTGTVDIETKKDIPHWTECFFSWYEANPDVVDLSNYVESAGRLTGGNDSWRMGGAAPMKKDHIHAMWARAKNATQWRAPRL